MAMNNLELTEGEYNKLRDLFRACSFAEHDDMALADFGNHRSLYDYITKELRIDCENGRGPAYSLAKRLLDFNVKFRIKTHRDIKHSALRTMLARELLALRHVCHKDTTGIMNPDYVFGIRMGLDTAYRRTQYWLDTGKLPELRLR